MSESKLPNGGYSITNGSNYMLDGFHFDTEYNNGVLDGARLPEAKGLASLPEGMIPPDSPSFSDIPLGISTETDLNMEEITREAGQNINLVDHSWLATQPEPDLKGQRSLEEILSDMKDGKSGNPEANQLQTLQDSWGTSTDGIKIIPNDNRKNIPYQNSYRKEQSSLPGDDYRKKQEKLHRKLAYGQNILKEVADKDLRNKLSSEYGLLGQVYIYAKDFPGIFNGKWNEVINKRCASCLYIVANKDTAFDRFLGMQVIDSVEKVSWKKAYNALSPKFQACGIITEQGASYKLKVKNASIQYLEGKDFASQKQTWFPTQSFDFENISSKEASDILDQIEIDYVRVGSLEDREKSKIEARLHRIATQLIEQNFLEVEQVSTVLSSGSDSTTKIQKLYRMASTPSTSSDYKGYGTDISVHDMKKRVVYEGKISSEAVTQGQKIASDIKSYVANNIISQKDADTALSLNGDSKFVALYKLAKRGIASTKKDFSGQKFEAHSPTRSYMSSDAHIESKKSRNIAKRNAKALEKVAGLIKSGAVTIEEVESITKGIKNPEEKVASIYKHLAKPKQAKNYEGNVSTAHFLSSRTSMSKKTASDVQSEKIETWLRQKMSEGSAGNEIDILLATRFSETLLNKHQEKIASIRSQHEGLSGHIYVDASSYLTQGMDGCDNGALVHRANQIPTLVKTSKCGGCVFNSGGMCQKYSKVIVGSSKEIVENPASYQKEMIRLANASDSEKTAALFVNNYDANEFNLMASENIQLEEEMPGSEKLGSIFFGGIEL